MHVVTQCVTYGVFTDIENHWELSGALIKPHCITQHGVRCVPSLTLQGHLISVRVNLINSAIHSMFADKGGGGSRFGARR